MKRAIKWGVIALVLVVVIAVVAVSLSLNGLVKKGVESASTQSLGLKTTLDSASVSLVGGSVGLNDLAIASTAGFDAPHFLELGGVKLNVSLSELRQTPIRVSSLAVNKPRLVIEQKGMKLNLMAVKDALPATDPNAAPPPKLVIGEIKVDGASVVLRPGLPGLSQEIVVALPDIVINDIGTADEKANGIAIKNAMLAVATAMADKAMDSDQIPAELKALMKLDLAGLKAQLGQQVELLQDQLKDQANDATQKLKDGADKAKQEADKAAADLKKKAQEGLGGMFKKP